MKHWRLTLVEGKMAQVRSHNIQRNKNLPGAKNFGAAHRLPQVTHRSVLWVPLMRQLDVKRIK